MLGRSSITRGCCEDTKSRGWEAGEGTGRGERRGGVIYGLFRVDRAFLIKENDDRRKRGAMGGDQAD